MKKVSLFLLFILATNLFASGHNWHIGVFGGMTNNIEAEHSDFTLGADIEYKLPLAHNLFGVGVIGDFIFAEHQENLIMGGIFIHPLNSLKFVIGNGVAFSKIEEEGIEETESAHVLRIGTAYDFHISQFTISPTVNYDLIHSNGSIAYGITLGLGF